MHKKTISKQARWTAVLLALLLSIGVVSPLEAHAAGPCRVDGYTYHARLQMSVRDIGHGEVVAAVNHNCHRGKWQADKQTWIYRGRTFDFPKRPVVVMNRSAIVVSVWWPSRSGRGGGGGWENIPWREIPSSLPTS